MSSYEDDIRRIANQKRIKGGLSSIQDREPIPGDLTPFINTVFSPDSNGGAGKDGGVDGEDPNSFVEPDRNDPDNPNNPGNSGGGGGGSARDPKRDGPQDVEDLLDDEKGPVPPDETAGDEYSGGALPKITGFEDCQTGQSVTVHLDGMFDVPEGWDSPEDPPDGGYTDSDTGKCFFPDYPCPEPGLLVHGGNTYSECMAQGGEHWVSLWIPHGDEPPYTYEDGFGPDNSPIPATEWPPDGEYDLVFKDGTFQSSTFDSEAPATTQEPTSVINLCTPSGRFVTVRAASNGGSMVYETVTEGGAPTNTMKVYNSDGTMRMAGDATQSNINSYLPR